MTSSDAPTESGGPVPGKDGDLRTVLIPQCGHLAQEGAPDKANAALLDLLRGWTG